MTVRDTAALPLLAELYTYDPNCVLIRGHADWRPVHLRGSRVNIGTTLMQPSDASSNNRPTHQWVSSNQPMNVWTAGADGGKTITVIYGQQNAAHLSASVALVSGGSVPLGVSGTIVESATLDAPAVGDIRVFMGSASSQIFCGLPAGRSSSDRCAYKVALGKRLFPINLTVNASAPVHVHIELRGRVGDWSDVDDTLTWFCGVVSGTIDLRGLPPAPSTSQITVDAAALSGNVPMSFTFFGLEG